MNIYITKSQEGIMYLCKNNLIAFMAIGLLLIGLGLMNSCKGKKAADTGLTQLEKAPDIKERLEQFSPTELAIDESILNEEQKLVLDKLIQASRHIDTIFWKQASSNGLSLKAALEISEDPADKDYLEYLKIHYGPFDRLDAHKPFIGTEAKPPGAALYPPDMTKEEGIALIKTAISSSRERDAGSGHALQICVIDKDGFNQVE